MGDGLLYVEAGDSTGPLAVAEGPVDALSIAWNEGRDAIAVGGRNFEGRAGRIKRAGRPIEIWGDADIPGQIAAWKLRGALADADIPARIVDLAGAPDPAAFFEARLRKKESL